MRLRLGTRGSTLAVTQSTHVAEALRALGHEVELIRITTHGDKARGSLMTLAGLGVFAAELRRALLDQRCDFAVHSLKDLPVEGVPGLMLAAIPEREDPRDALCSLDDRRLAELPAGARVGTGSPRRIAQLRGIRPDLEYVDIRGNIDTRLSRVAPGDLDAVVLAAAGLNRLGLQARISEVLDILPSPGQGALALECRRDNVDVIEALSALDHPDTRTAVTAERALLRALGGGCAAPIGALGTAARSADGEAAESPHLTGGVFAMDGTRNLILSVSVSTPEAAGQWIAQELVIRGAGDICDISAARDSRLEELHDDAPKTLMDTILGDVDRDTADDGTLWPRGTQLRSARVFLPREQGPMSAAIEAAGPTVFCEPLIERRVLQESAHLDDAAWVAITSARTVVTLAELGVRIPAGSRIAAVGHATARALEADGYTVDLVPDGPSSAADLVRVFPEGTGRVAIPGSALSSRELVDGLRRKGWDAEALPIYTVVPVESPSAGLRDRWNAEGFDAIVVTSGSIARAVDQLLGWPSGIRVLAFGQPTAAVLAELGVPNAVVPSQDAEAVVDALSDLLTKGQA